MNVALAANGGVASASSVHTLDFPASSANNGDRRGSNLGSGGVWIDATWELYPDWLEIDFNASYAVNRINVFTMQDALTAPAEPTETLTFSQYGITAFQVQYWTGTAWATVPGGSVTGNNNVWRSFTFSAITTNRIRVLVTGAAFGFSSITEVEAFTP